MRDPTPGEIIVCSVYRGTWRWHMSDYLLWYMDLNLLARRNVTADEVRQERFGIVVLNEASALDFFQHMQEYQLTIDELRTTLRVKVAVAKSFADVADL